MTAPDANRIWTQRQQQQMCRGANNVDFQSHNVVAQLMMPKTTFPLMWFKPRFAVVLRNRRKPQIYNEDRKGAVSLLAAIKTRTLRDLP